MLDRLDYQPLFGKMSPHSSPERASLRGGSRTRPGRRRKSSLYARQSKGKYSVTSSVHLAPVVQRVDSPIQRINLYPLDSAISFTNTYPLDSAIGLTLIRWIVIFPVDSAIQRFNNWGLYFKRSKATTHRNNRRIHRIV